MPGSTTFASIKFSEGPDEVNKFPAEVSSPGAKTIDKYLEEHTLTFKTRAVSYTAVSGELGVLTAAGQTVTLPAAATASQIIGVMAKGNSNNTKITTSGGAFIIGDFITEPSKTATVVLQESQHIILFSDGTNWLIVAGEPKREQKYEEKTFTKAEIEAGVEISASRMTFVNTLSTGLGSPTVGGVSVTLPYLIPPGQKLKGTTGSASVTATFLGL